MLVAMSYFCWMNNTKVRHILYYNYIHGKLSLHQLCDPRHTHIDLRNLIPGGEIHHTCYWKIKDRLKCFHSSFCLQTIDAICPYGWNRRVSFGNGSKLFLKLTHFCPAGTDLQIVTGPGAWNTGNLICCIDIHIISVEIPQDFNGGIALISQTF